jgi:hypothetical protein
MLPGLSKIFGELLVFVFFEQSRDSCLHNGKAVSEKRKKKKPYSAYRTHQTETLV